MILEIKRNEKLSKDNNNNKKNKKKYRRKKLKTRRKKNKLKESFSVDDISFVVIVAQKINLLLYQ